ncbi:SDR family oxidoreductase [Halorubrum sp. AD140]|uniref:SDR family oxidoreductase n=1 Tax=Halorubrum sp. AD140 TaxID=3050073 RepID=UPI002ACC73DC|nr:SDR family oxidoreductase [Halorubrum sp. AD140]MDZ5811305.1 SDR family oxidoreductase [Halorubrum sp. AD140]
MTKSILVTGATGTVGGHVARELVEADAATDADVAVRAGVRSVDRARGSLPAAVEPVAFDFEKPETWGAAFEGVDALFLVRPPEMARVHRHVTPAVDAAERVGVEHAVFLSVLGAEKNPLLPHRRIERHLEEGGLSYAFLRASFFMQNFSEVHRSDVAERDELFVPAGDGETSFVDARDVAAVGVEALVDPAHRNRAYDVTGPEALTYDEAAAVFSDALGREIAYADPGLVEFLVSSVRRGVSPSFALAQAVIYTTARLGLAGRVSDDAERVLGRPPRSLSEFVRDHAAAFDPNVASGSKPR